MSIKSERKKQIKAEKQAVAVNSERKRIFKAELDDDGNYYIIGATSAEDAKARALRNPVLPNYIAVHLNFEEASASEQREWAGRVCLCNHSECVN